MARITLRDGTDASLVLVGDSGAGKSETLEALRTLAGDEVQHLDIICDDMGSLKIHDSKAIKGYGTEKGAFVRLDDLQQGYAFSQLDRSIFMSPQRSNSRALMPISSMNQVLSGMSVDYILYANNYEEPDEDHPIIERFNTLEEANSVFKEGARMAKGTTQEAGLVHAYYANPFGPPQYREMHQSIADRFFSSFFEEDIYVGQLRTRLGIDGYEEQGAKAAARELLRLIRTDTSS